MTTEAFKQDLIPRPGAGNIPLVYLLQRIVDQLNSGDKRHVPRAMDANRWVECMPDVDAPAYSILGVQNHTNLTPIGALHLLEDVNEDTQIYVGNENYPLKAGEKGWCKLLNADVPVKVRTDIDPDGDPWTYLDQPYILDQMITGTLGSGTPAPITPNGRMWTAGPPSSEGFVEVFHSLGGVTGIRVMQYNGDTVGTGTGTGSGSGPVLTSSSGLTAIMSSVTPAGGEEEVGVQYLSGFLAPGDSCWVAEISGALLAIVGAGGVHLATGVYTGGGLSIGGSDPVAASIYCDDVLVDGDDVLAAYVHGGVFVIFGVCC